MISILGLTNNYLISRNDKNTLRYNNVSVFEQFHVCESFNLINSNLNKYDIFNKLSNDDYKIIRKRIVQCVLVTNILFRNKLSQFLKTRINTFKIQQGNNIEKI